jgi:hypothetical protein
MPRPATARRPNSLAERPDRVALWAVALAVVALIAGAASAQAGSSGGAAIGDGGSGGGAGGAGGGGAATSGGCPAEELGRRTLKLGDCGDDVRTLNWILKSKSYQSGVALADQFENPTAATVREFERRSSLAVDGVVEDETTAALVRSMPSQLATWYGPGFWGNRTACGQRLERRTVGVAHRTLPCGSKVVVRHNGRFLRTRVIDAGPFANGAQWDLTQRAARLVGLDSTDRIRVAKIAKR